MAPVDPQMDPLQLNDNPAILQLIPSKMEGIVLPALIPGRFALETLNQEIHKNPHFRGEMAVGRIKHEDAKRLILKCPQQGLQPAGPNSGARHETGHPGDSQPGFCRRQAGIGTGEAEASHDFDEVGFAALVRPKMPDQWIAKIGVDDAVMAGKVSRRLRCAAP